MLGIAHGHFFTVTISASNVRATETHDDSCSGTTDKITSSFYF